jgi:DHA1 family bicyclomycin/chloramphenicol resistance-like MFS transporter
VAILAGLDRLDWLTFTILMLAFNSLFLIVFANAASLVIDPHKEIAGLASSMFGAMTQLFGSIMMFLTLPLFKGAMVPWSLGLVTIGVLVAAGLVAYRPKPSPSE